MLDTSLTGHRSNYHCVSSVHLQEPRICRRATGGFQSMAAAARAPRAARATMPGRRRTRRGPCGGGGRCPRPRRAASRRLRGRPDHGVDPLGATRQPVRPGSRGDGHDRGRCERAARGQTTAGTTTVSHSPVRFRRRCGLAFAADRRVSTVSGLGVRGPRPYSAYRARDCKKRSPSTPHPGRRARGSAKWCGPYGSGGWVGPAGLWGLR